MANADTRAASTRLLEDSLQKRVARREGVSRSRRVTNAHPRVEAPETCAGCRGRCYAWKIAGSRAGTVLS